jgi:hypothetical protein
MGHRLAEQAEDPGIAVDCHEPLIHEQLLFDYKKTKKAIPKVRLRIFCHPEPQAKGLSPFQLRFFAACGGSE